jgi:hypothetical protein
MPRSRVVEIGVVIALVFLGILSVVLLSGVLHRKPVTLRGAVITADSDPKKQIPIDDVEVTASDQTTTGSKSDSSGLWVITLPKGARRGEPVTLWFRREDYQPLELKEFVGDKLYIAHMQPVQRETRAQSNHPPTVIGSPSVRYSVKATTDVDIGSAVKTFEVVNKGDVPCNGQHPCSPDGKWKAAIGSATLDAGPENVFQNARASCIAGPCPFTHVESDELEQGGQTIKVSARNWSDTATFLVEAEVVHPMVSNVVRQSYPVIFGRALNFTLPKSAEGVSIEAELSGETIVFPLGPDLLLSWANCNVRISNDENDETKVYRCELKPGFRFK